MIDRDQLVEVVPHYAALVLLILLTFGAVRTVVGDVGFWIEVLIALAVAAVYPPLVRRLGIAPSAWERPEDAE